MLECLQYVLLSLMGILGATEITLGGVGAYMDYRANHRPPHIVQLSQEDRDNLFQNCWPLIKKSLINKVDKSVKDLKDRNLYSSEYEQEEKAIREKIDQADKAIREKTNQCGISLGGIGLEVDKLVSDFEYKVCQEILLRRHY